MLTGDHLLPGKQADPLIYQPGWPVVDLGALLEDKEISRTMAHCTVYLDAISLVDFGYRVPNAGSVHEGDEAMVTGISRAHPDIEPRCLTTTCRSNTVHIPYQSNPDNLLALDGVLRLRSLDRSGGSVPEKQGFFERHIHRGHVQRSEVLVGLTDWLGLQWGHCDRLLYLYGQRLGLA